MIFADITDALWAKELPHKELLLAGLYHVPGGILVALGAVALRMVIEEVLKHISLGLARSRLWTALCVILWLVIMRTTTVSDSFAKKIRWNELFPAEAASTAPPPGATQGRPAGR
ncbi:MAG: hypothetical protein HYY25_13530 [Candidatus Wallbacteria bacterium]|nr:hypothetical protein [Candidatus Wallbacteria bacterium]